MIPAVYTSDLDATMRVRLVSGTGRVGLFFHSAGDGDLQLALNPSGALQMVRSDPRAPQPGPLATFQTGATLGKDVEIRLVVVGTAITVYADGKEVGRATSPGQRTGGIGILVGSFDSGVTAQVQSLKILGTAVAAPVGASTPQGPACGAAPLPACAAGAPGGPQGPACGTGTLPACAPGQGGAGGTPAPTLTIRKGAQLYAWKTGDALTNLAIERTGTASSESTTGGLRVVVGGRPEDSVKISLPVPPDRPSWSTTCWSPVARP